MAVFVLDIVKQMWFAFPPFVVKSFCKTCKSQMFASRVLPNYFQMTEEALVFGINSSSGSSNVQAWPSTWNITIMTNSYYGEELSRCIVGDTIWRSLNMDFLKNGWTLVTLQKHQNMLVTIQKFISSSPFTSQNDCWYNSKTWSSVLICICFLKSFIPNLHNHIFYPQSGSVASLKWHPPMFLTNFLNL